MLGVEGSRLFGLRGRSWSGIGALAGHLKQKAWVSSSLGWGVFFGGAGYIAQSSKFLELSRCLAFLPSPFLVCEPTLARAGGGFDSQNSPTES